MNIKTLHSWDISPEEAVKLQKELAAQIETRTPLVKCQFVAGADASYSRGSDVMFATVVVLNADDGSVVEVQNAVGETQFPYVPGLLSFREAPVLLDAFAKLETQPDVVMFDGQGIAHPRRMGIASHVGLFLDIPTLGCAKSRLFGRFKEPDEKAGSLSPLKDKDDIVGSVVRTKNNVKPVFVSAGHRIDLASAIRVTLEMCRGYRLPEPTRLAHIKVNEYRRQVEGSS